MPPPPHGPAADPGIAPADAILSPAWSAWRKFLAYAALAALAVASVCFIDAKVHRPEFQHAPAPLTPPPGQAPA